MSRQNSKSGAKGGTSAKKDARREDSDVGDYSDYHDDSYYYPYYYYYSDYSDDEEPKPDRAGQPPPPTPAPPIVVPPPPPPIKKPGFFSKLFNCGGGKKVLQPPVALPEVEAVIVPPVLKPPPPIQTEFISDACDSDDSYYYSDYSTESPAEKPPPPLPPVQPPPPPPPRHPSPVVVKEPPAPVIVETVAPTTIASVLPDETIDDEIDRLGAWIRGEVYNLIDAPKTNLPPSDPTKYDNEILMLKKRNERMHAAAAARRKARDILRRNGLDDTLINQDDADGFTDDIRENDDRQPIFMEKTAEEKSKHKTQPKKDTIPNIQVRTRVAFDPASGRVISTEYFEDEIKNRGDTVEEVLLKRKQRNEEEIINKLRREGAVKDIEVHTNNLNQLKSLSHPSEHQTVIEKPIPEKPIMSGAELQKAASDFATSTTPSSSLTPQQMNEYALLFGEVQLLLKNIDSHLTELNHLEIEPLRY